MIFVSHRNFVIMKGPGFKSPCVHGFLFVPFGRRVRRDLDLNLALEFELLNVCVDPLDLVDYMYLRMYGELVLCYPPALPQPPVPPELLELNYSTVAWKFFL